MKLFWHRPSPLWANVTAYCVISFLSCSLESVEGKGLFTIKLNSLICGSAWHKSNLQQNE